MNESQVRAMFAAKDKTLNQNNRSNITRSIDLPNAVLTLETDEYLETKVVANDKVLFVIQQRDIDDFENDLDALINKYSI